MILSKSEVAAIRERAEGEVEAARRTNRKTMIRVTPQQLAALIDTIEAFAEALQKAESHIAFNKWVGDPTSDKRFDAIQELRRTLTTYHTSPTEGGTPDG